MVGKIGQLLLYGTGTSGTTVRHLTVDVAGDVALEACYLQGTKPYASKDCIFFVPGVGSDMIINEAMLSIMSQHYPTFSFCYRGHGNSGGRFEIDPRVHVQDARSVLAHFIRCGLIKNQVILVGQSLGTYIVRALYPSLEHTRIRQLIFLSPSALDLRTSLRPYDTEYAFDLTTLVLLGAVVWCRLRPGPRLGGFVRKGMWLLVSDLPELYTHIANLPAWSILLPAPTTFHAPLFIAVPGVDPISNPQNLVEHVIRTNEASRYQVHINRGATHAQEALPILSTDVLQRALYWTREEQHPAAPSTVVSPCVETRSTATDQLVRAAAGRLPFPFMVFTMEMLRSYALPLSSAFRYCVHTRVDLGTLRPFTCVLTGDTTISATLEASSNATISLYLFRVSAFSSTLCGRAFVHCSEGSRQYTVTLPGMSEHFAPRDRLEVGFSTVAADICTHPLFPQNQSHVWLRHVGVSFVAA